MDLVKTSVSYQIKDVHSIFCGHIYIYSFYNIFVEGLRELKVFVDLALISAGEQPMDIDRVQALNTAVLGYSALIFDLTPGSDYNVLLSKCQEVWKELETNRSLPQKLVSIKYSIVLTIIYYAE